MRRTFPTASLYGKVANIRNDLDSHAVRNTGIVKEMIAGDRITVEQKNEDLFEFRVTQKLLFAANQVPDVPDADGAFYRRWLVVEFPPYGSSRGR